MSPSLHMHTTTMPRTISLVVFNSPLFPAHWGLWIPHLSSDLQGTGTYLNATGDAAIGFTVEIERNYKVGADGWRYQPLPLGDAADEHVTDTQVDGSWSVDKIARDRLEEVVLGVEPPGPSLVATSGEGPRKRVEIKNCQTWIHDAVKALVEAGVMDHTALQNVENAPKD